MWTSTILVLLLGNSRALPQGRPPIPEPRPALFNLEAKSDSFSEVRKAFREDWPELQSKSGRNLKIVLDRGLKEEEFVLSVGKVATLRVGSPVAAAWGLQTLGQLALSGIVKAEIHEEPAYGFRCVTIDVARRFHSMSTLRQIVRWCNAAKIRFIQLHLTDDQNWMLPTKLFAGIDRNNSSHHPAYTKQEVLDLQTFAGARGVAITPELDIPGHSSLLVKFDPKKFAIQGSASTNCINFGSPEVIQTMRALIREIAAEFPLAPSIHIGGDEAWYPDAEKDPEIAMAMKAIGPKATVQDVFVDFIVEMAKEVVYQKKIPMVWEGFGRTPYAKKKIFSQIVIIAWEGAYYPAQDLLDGGFRVVNAGWDPYYVVNHYPYDSYTLVPLPNLLHSDPETFGIVNFSPGTSGTVKLHSIGNLYGSMMCWWEGYEWNAQTTLPLRILAFGSRLWNKSGDQDYAKFLTNSKAILQHIQIQTIPFQVSVEGSRPNNRLEFTDHATVRVMPGDSSLTIAMRSDGGVPMLADAKESLDVGASKVVTIQAFRGSVPVGETEFLNLKKIEVTENLALGAKAWGSTPEDPQFPARLVTDGVADDVGSFWLGYPNPCSLTIDLGSKKQMNRVDVVPFWAAHLPTQYFVDLSEDQKSWENVVDASNLDEAPTKAGYVHRFPAKSARYIRVRITGSKQFPPSMARIHEVRAFLEL